MTYKVKDVLEIIRFNTSTLNQLSGHAWNGLFTNKNIVYQLKLSLDKYAKVTEAIEDYYSIPMELKTEFVAAAPLALRSEAYRYAMIWQANTKYPIDASDINRIENTFRYQSMAGIPRWFMVWDDKIYISPSVSFSYKTTTLASSILKTDTTITLTDASSWLPYQGRLTIGTEKIVYQYRTGNVLYNCERGREMTTAAAHTALDVVNENNLWFFYRRLHRDIPISSDDWITEDVLNQNMEICDEHIEVITDYTSYKLLSKIDAGRAAPYKINFDEWLQKAKWDIDKGRARTKKTGDIRDPYFVETSTAYMQLPAF